MLLTKAKQQLTLRRASLLLLLLLTPQGVLSQVSVSLTEDGEPARTPPFERAASQGVVRFSAATYSAGTALTITIEAHPGRESKAWSVEHIHPRGWTVLEVDGGGLWDSRGSRIRWGPWFDSIPRTLTYRLLPDRDKRYPGRFSGSLFVDGLEVALMGTTELKAQGGTSALPHGDSASSSGDEDPSDQQEKNPTGYEADSVGHVSLLALPQCVATRVTPNGYQPGATEDFAVSAKPPNTGAAYVIEETPPSASWPISSISHGGVFDVVSNKLRWGPFFDAAPRVLRYSITIPPETSGAIRFSGSVVVDGVAQQTCGLTSVPIGRYHPADAGRNWRIAGTELTGYGASWKKGEVWSLGPTPTPIDLVTSAATIWKQGECYAYAPVEDPPYFWTPLVTAITPDPPSIGTPTTTTIPLAWNPVPGALTYRVQASGGPATIVAYSGPALNALADGLIQGVRYCFQVYAFNNCGSSKASAPTCGTTDCLTPTTSPTLSLSVATATAIKLNWTSVPGSSGYRIKRGNNEFLVGPVTTYTDSGLSRLTRYCYTVTAVTNCGDSQPSSEICATTTCEVQPIAIAPTVSLGTVTSSAIVVNWTAVPGASGYTVIRGDTEIPINGTGTSYTDSGLTQFTRYCYAVSARNSCGSGPLSAETCASTACSTLARPALSLGWYTATSITLGWSTVEGATSYKLVRNGTLILIGTSRSWTDSALQPSTRYCYSVTATNECSDSAASNEVCVTTSANRQPPLSK